MKQYKIMVKSIKTGEWFRATHGLQHKNANGVLNVSKEEVIKVAEGYMKRDAEREFPNWSEYKIMEREVSDWNDCE